MILQNNNDDDDSKTGAMLLWCGHLRKGQCHCSGWTSHLSAACFNVQWVCRVYGHGYLSCSLFICTANIYIYMYKYICLSLNSVYFLNGTALTFLTATIISTIQVRLRHMLPADGHGNTSSRDRMEEAHRLAMGCRCDGMSLPHTHHHTFEYSRTATKSIMLHRFHHLYVSSVPFWPRRKVFKDRIYQYILISYLVKIGEPRNACTFNEAEGHPGTPTRSDTSPGSTSKKCQDAIEERQFFSGWKLEMYHSQTWIEDILGRIWLVYPI